MYEPAETLRDARELPPSLDEAFDLLDLAYGAGRDPSAWREVLELLARLLGAPRVALVEEEPEVFRVLAASDLVPATSSGPRPLPRLEIVRAAGEVSALIVRIGGSLRLLVGCRELPRRAARLLARVAPHLARAWREAEVEVDGGRDALAGAALDRLAFGVVLCAGDGAVRVANAAARELLSRRDGLRLERGFLRAGSPAVQVHLARSLSRLAGRSHGSGAALRVPRAGSAGPLELLVTPLAASLAPLEPEATPCCVIFLADPSHSPETPAEILRSLYGLTRAESRVARELLQGRLAEEIATALGISPHTVRTHLKRIFEKVGTSRQSDLVRLLLCGPGRLRWG